MSVQVTENDWFSSDDRNQGDADGEPAPTDTASADGSAEGGGPAPGFPGVPPAPATEAVRRLEDEVAQARDRHLRLAAEFDNYRKRIAKERVELSDRAQAAFVIRLVDVLDDLDRIVDDARNTPPDALREALVLVDRKLRKELEAAGVERIDPVGRAFDPSEHEAVSTVPPPEPDKDHMVSATFQTGYRFKGQLVRPARVQVYSSQGAG
jgi:molecular chaperone GrpE